MPDVSPPQTLSRALLHCFVELLVIFILIYVVKNSFTAVGRERLRSAWKGIPALIGFTCFWVTLLYGLFLWLRIKNPDQHPAKTVISGALVVLFLWVFYCLFKAAIEAFARDPGPARQTIERGRHIGTLEEAREGLEAQAGRRPQTVVLARRSLLRSLWFHLTSRN